MNILLGISLILGSLIIFSIQIRQTYKYKESFTIGDVKLTFAGLFSFLGGLYLLINSF